MTNKFAFMIENTKLPKIGSVIHITNDHVVSITVPSQQYPTLIIFTHSGRLLIINLKISLQQFTSKQSKLGIWPKFFPNRNHTFLGCFLPAMPWNCVSLEPQPTVINSSTSNYCRQLAIIILYKNWQKCHY